MIMKGENGKWWDAARGIALDSLDELLGNDGCGRIVPIMEIDRERGGVEMVGMEWVGPEPARLSARLLYDMGVEAYNLSYGDKFWVGPFHVGLLDFNQGFGECLVYRLNGNLSRQLNIVLFRLKRLANTTEERLRWTAVVWNLIPQRVTEPEWKNLRPYRWLRDKWDLFLAPGSPPKDLPR